MHALFVCLAGRRRDSKLEWRRAPPLSGALHDWAPEAGIARRTPAAAQGSAMGTAGSIAKWLRLLAAAY